MAGIMVGSIEVQMSNGPLSYQGKAGRDGIDEAGIAHTAVLRTPDGFEGTVAVIEWSNGNVDVRLVDFAKGADEYRRLERAGTMSIEVANGRWLGLLRALKYSDKGYATLHQVSWDDLDGILGGSSEALLASHGASTTGRYIEIRSNASTRHANSLAFAAEAGNAKPVIAAYALTRVLPLMHNFGLAVPEAFL